MHPLVRDLFKRIIYVGRDYPKGLEYVKKVARRKISAKKHLKSEADIKRAVHEGRWWVKEMQGVIQLKKYRTMKQRYVDDPETPSLLDPAARPPPEWFHMYKE